MAECRGCGPRRAVIASEAKQSRPAVRRLRLWNHNSTKDSARVAADALDAVDRRDEAKSLRTRYGLAVSTKYCFGVVGEVQRGCSIKAKLRCRVGKGAKR